MGKTLRVLFVEDNENDTLLLSREIKNAGYDLFYERVENSQEMGIALAKQWDMVFSDYYLPFFSALEALRLVRGNKELAHIPFVIVSGTIGEEGLLETLKEGASNYLLKDNLTRLSVIIEQELALAEKSKALRKAQEDLFFRSKEWEKTFNAIRDSVILLDMDGRVLNCNSVTLEWLKKEKEEVLGKHCYEIVHGKQAPIEDCPVIRIKKSLRREQMVLQSGEKWLEVTVDPLFDDKGDLVKIVHVMSDVSERKKMQDILKRDKDYLEKLINERTFELMKAQKELDDAKRLSDIGIFSATIAHELRNPLGVIKTAVYNIRNIQKDSLLDSHLANIDKKVLESDQIIKNLLSYSRIKMPKYENVEIINILNACISQCKDKYAKWAVEVKTRFGPERENIIDADSLHMTELFTNILDNAYQAFPDKKGEIEIGLDYNRTTNKLDISFKDNGIGIEENDLEKVFDPFFTNKARGIGLGLTLCKQVVTLHSGTIDIKSKKGEGTTVLLSLPIKIK